MASDAERVYADGWTDSLDSLDSLEKQMGRSEKSQARVISTKTPRLWIRSGSADSARFRVGDVRHKGSTGDVKNDAKANLDEKTTTSRFQIRHSVCARVDRRLRADASPAHDPRFRVASAS